MKNVPFIVVSVLLLALYFGFGCVVDRANFTLLTFGFVALFIAFGGWCFMARKVAAAQVVFFAVAVRLVLLFSPPVLSDDAYRFVWDGRLLVGGHNPMEYLPTDAVDLPDADAMGLTHSLWLKLNSKDYYTVYPPLHQLFFAAGVGLYPNSELKSISAMRLLVLLVEVLGLLAMVNVLRLLNRNPREVGLYALNPLVVVEGIGNLHFEVAVVGLLGMALWLAMRAKRSSWWLSGGFFGLAVLMKLTPLVLGPLLLVAIPARGRWPFFITAAAVQVVGWWYFVSPEVIENFTTSLDLYFRRFEFNASVYYLAREIGEAVYGYNAIAVVGPLLGALSLLSILSVALVFRLLRMRGERFGIAHAAVLSWLLYLLFATTVHPWYAIVPLAIGVFTRFRTALLVWGFTVLWSYVHYDNSQFSENYVLIAASYLLPIIVYFFWPSSEATTKQS